ncbi:MAG: hypothetical protein JWN34_2098 [Bryobacterales bacterium]|nr:hypothetical protein [Bryobacterales bacterium]
MKTLITLAMILAVPAFSQSTSAKKKTATKAPAKPATNVVKPLVIPPDATPNPDGTYAWSDKAGKKWTFAKTPFGISKVEDTAGQPSAFASAPVGQFVKAVEVGDKVKFERQSPFGPTKWEKNKADLTDEERAILAAQTAKPE